MSFFVQVPADLHQITWAFLTSEQIDSLPLVRFDEEQQAKKFAWRMHELTGHLLAVRRGEGEYIGNRK